MVVTDISNVKFDIWANVPDEDALFDVVVAELNEAADEVTIVEAKISEEGTNKDFHFEIVFDVWTEGLFVGDVVASEIKTGLEEYDDHQSISFLSLNE